MKRLIFLVMLCFLIMASSQTVKAEHPRELNVTLFSDGWAHVEITEQVSSQEKNLILALPTDSYEYLIVMNENSIILNYTTVGKNLFVELENSSRITAIFQTQALTSKKGAIWNFSIGYDADIAYVTLPPGSVMVGVSEVPDRVMKKGDSLSLVFKKGSLWVSYMMPVQPISQTQPSRPSSSEERGKTGTALVPNPLYILFPVVIAFATLLLYIKRKKRHGSEELDPDEKVILNELMRRGGSMYQSELVKVLGLPKTTVWRKINRLSEKGVIIVEKSERGNIIHLK